MLELALFDVARFRKEELATYGGPVKERLNLAYLTFVFTLERS